MHQRNQRRDDDRDAVPGLLPGDGGDLVAQRFAATRRHQHQRIATRDHVADDGLLRPAKLLVAKDFTQDGAAGVGRAGGVFRRRRSVNYYHSNSCSCTAC